jgi:hypothetical protein
VIEVRVVVQHGHVVQLADGGDEQIGDSDGACHRPRGELSLHVECAVPRLLVGDEELVCHTPISTYLLVPHR